MSQSTNCACQQNPQQTMSTLTSNSSRIVYRGTTSTLHAFNAQHKHLVVFGMNSRVCRHERVVPGVGKVLAPITCSAVVDRPPEFDLHSVDLGWPRGFPSRYDLGDQLGRGSFGTVYLATDRLTGEEVAAKVIPKERKGTTREHILEKIHQEVCNRQLPLTLTDLQTVIRGSYMVSTSRFVRLQVDVLRRMQGRDEALRLLSVYEVQSHFCQNISDCSHWNAGMKACVVM